MFITIADMIYNIQQFQDYGHPLVNVSCVNFDLRPQMAAQVTYAMQTQAPNLKLLKHWIHYFKAREHKQHVILWRQSLAI